MHVTWVIFLVGRDELPAIVVRLHVCYRLPGGWAAAHGFSWLARAQARANGWWQNLQRKEGAAEAAKASGFTTNNVCCPVTPETALNNLVCCSGLGVVFCTIV